MNTTEDCIDACNSLLRGEFSAIETYGQAIEKFTGRPEASILTDLRASHAINADLIRQHILSMRGTPTTDSGAWGAFAIAIEGLATLIGGSSALQALIAGEEHGIADYDDALKDENIMEEMKSIICENLLPTLHDNVARLKRLATERES